MGTYISQIPKALAHNHPEKKEGGGGEAGSIKRIMGSSACKTLEA